MISWYEGALSTRCFMLKGTGIVTAGVVVTFHRLGGFHRVRLVAVPLGDSSAAGDEDGHQDDGEEFHASHEVGRLLDGFNEFLVGHG